MLQSRATRIEYPPMGTCPICGATGEVVGANYFWVECTECSYTDEMWHDSPAEAIRIWNSKRKIGTTTS